MDWERGASTVFQTYTQITALLPSPFSRPDITSPHSHFFSRYLQVGHFVRQQVSDFPTRPQDCYFYGALLLQPSKHLISRFITAFEAPASTGHLRDTWADEAWEEGRSNIHKCSVNSRYWLIQFKVTHRLHYSKTQLNKIFGSLCDRCGRAKRTLTFILVLLSTGQLLARHI